MCEKSGGRLKRWATQPLGKALIGQQVAKLIINLITIAQVGSVLVPKNINDAILVINKLRLKPLFEVQSGYCMVIAEAVSDAGVFFPSDACSEPLRDL